MLMMGINFAVLSKNNIFINLNIIIFYFQLCLFYFILMKKKIPNEFILLYNNFSSLVFSC